ncbi:MAG: hypothetical protein JWN23_1799 [Rhodocyclales bacterium]|nr:hypothetical protein [Rhodocyclales bacterium]
MSFTKIHAPTLGDVMKKDLIVCVFIVLFCPSAQAEVNEGSLCQSVKSKSVDEFSKKNLVSSKEHDGDEYKYTNVDVDGDSISDDIVGGCSNSMPPADACVLSLKTSKGKIFGYSNFSINEKFFLFASKYKIYAYVTTAEDSGEKTRVLRVGPSSIYEICKK